MPRTRTPAPPGHKHCHRCETTRPLSDFAGDASKSDGLRVCCRSCDQARQKARYWTKDRLKARKQRRAEARQRALEKKYGSHWLAQQEKLRAEEARAERAAEMEARREAAKERFWAGVRARSSRSTNDQA